MQSNHILAIAHNWLNTPFHLTARQKGVGADCGGLIIGVALELGIEVNIPQCFDYNLNNYEGLMQRLLTCHLKQANQIDVGVVVLVESALGMHLGIISEVKPNLYWIHACMRAGKVVEQRLLPSIASKISKIYRFF
jgi:hypothetical protein